jgi:N-acetyl-alpha-D-muramate 1-phosphate uridylyltransferase
MGQVGGQGMAATGINSAMVLAAGYGQRMRPLTDDKPKPLVALAGRPLLDHVLDRLAVAGVARAVVNVHYLPELIEAHLAARRARPDTLIADERAQILDTGGAVQNALSVLGAAPFFVHNSDSVWIERNGSTLARMMDAFDENTMDTLLLLAPAAASIGYAGRGDYGMDGEGRPRRRRDGETLPLVFTGVSINHPRLFRNAPQGPFSILRLWDEAEAAKRLAAIQLDGLWMHVGTPEALAEAEERMRGGEG